jgi:3-dehydroquinate synthase
VTTTPRAPTGERAESATTWTRIITGYPVTVGRGTLSSVGAIAAATASAHRYALITDDIVGPLYAERVARSMPGGRPDILAIAPGEALKTRDSWARLTDELLDRGFGRDSAVIALGGGVIGDLAGFVAATFMRGIPYVQVPTTLLAMIDASIGGKTGVDTPAGKNLVGAFHRPASVVADLDVLGTLSARHLRAGFAEAIKHGVIADADYFRSVRSALPEILAEGAGSPDTLGVIRRSIEIKGDVVERDELEGGLRKVLNFGHTIGHAVETLSGYSLLHGEAIGIGMAVEASIAERAGIATPGTADEVRDAVARAGLATALPGDLAPARIVELAHADKKVRSGSLELALPLAIGDMAGSERGWTLPIPDSLVLEVLGDA